MRLPRALTASAVAATVVLGTATTAPAATGDSPSSPQWSGLASPESVLHDPRTDSYLVSNINGHVAARDDNGYIARLDPAGGVAERWIDGARHDVILNAPKGLALTPDTVWVADIDTVRGFDRRTGRPTAAVAVPGASFLNDIAIGPCGELYVTDSGVAPDESGEMVPTGTDAVHRIDRRGRGHTVHTVAAGRHLRQPNGILAQSDGRLLVGTRGADQLLTLDRRGAVVVRRTVPGQVVDGVQILPAGRTVVSTWSPAGLWLLNRDGTSSAVPGARADGAADFSLDRRRSRLLLPALLANELQVADVPRLRPAG